MPAMLGTATGVLRCTRHSHAAAPSGPRAQLAGAFCLECDVQAHQPATDAACDHLARRGTTFGLAIESKINEFVPLSRMGWHGYAPGTSPTFYDTWYLVQTPDGCQVVTEETGIEPMQPVCASPTQACCIAATICGSLR